MWEERLLRGKGGDEMKERCRNRLEGSVFDAAVTLVGGYKWEAVGV